MVRLGKPVGVNETVWVLFAGTVALWLTVIGVPLPGGVIVAVTVPVCELAVSLVTSVFKVSAAVDRFAASTWFTCELPTASAPSTWSWTGNWMPVLLSGGICVQSTLSTVNIDVGSLGLISIASEFVPETTRLVIGKVNLVYAPVTVADVATSVPLTQTFADPTTPFTIRVATWPAARLAVKSVRHHQGTSKAAMLSGPILFMEP